MLFPKKLKYNIVRKGKLKKYEYKPNSLKFGTIGLKAINSGLIIANNIRKMTNLIFNVY